MENKQDLPVGWKWVKLGEVCEVNPRKSSSFYRSPDAPTSFIPMESVDEKSGKILKPFVIPYSKVARGYTYFEENDILFAKITPCMQNGKHAIARNLIDGIGFGTTEFHVIRTKNAILPEWVWYFIRQKYFLTEAMKYFTGSVGQQRVPKSFLSDHIIPLPPLSEQKRIAAKLQETMQKIDQARTACEKQLEAAKSLPSAYLREVFESPESQKWERKKLGEVCEKIQYGLTATATDNKDGFPFIRITDIDDFGNINMENIKYVRCNNETLRKYELKEGDILFARTGSIGRTFLYNGIPSKAIFASYLIRFRPKKDIVDPLLIFYYSHSPSYFKFIGEKKHTVSQPNINAEEYKSLPLPLPPLSEQKRIAAYLKEKIDQAEKLRTSIEKELETINALPQSILSKAFRGEF